MQAEGGSRPAPDYSRQQMLPEIGAQGQALLARSRVLVVGAGGLGSPVLQYLAGAGVGCLGLVDADTVSASNLHRQPLYAFDEVGALKVERARAAIERINPTVAVETHAVRLGAGNALELVRAYDVVVDCCDNVRTKFLISDAAVLAQRPAVFASVYQYEGQLQVYRPLPSHACLRCLWPDAMEDGAVGNCAQSGVLGPVPGAFGSLQALLTLKILLDMAGQLAGELLLFDFMNFSMQRLIAPRRTGCPAPHCELVRTWAVADADLEILVSSLADASARGMDVIDVRTAQEYAAEPSTAAHIPIDRLLGEPTARFAGRQLLLICASGQRSAHAARALRDRGIAARSLAGGLASLAR